MAELLGHETWLQKVPRQMQQVGRSNLILTKKKFQKKIGEDLKKKKKNFNSAALEISSTALNCFCSS